MKIRPTSFLSLILTCFVFQLPSLAQITQKGRNIPYFLSGSETGSWSDTKSDVYVGGGASATAINSDVPIDASEEALVIETTLPSGYWNMIFRLGNGSSINAYRVGGAPQLHLKVKWTAIAADADLTIRAFTYTDDVENPGQEHGSVQLSNYSSPTTDWVDIYIPIKHFLVDNANANFTRVGFIQLLGNGTYSSTNRMLIKELEFVSGENLDYVDAVKINQLGYLPHQIKTAIVSFEPENSAIIPSTFEVHNEQQQTVLSGTLTRKQAFDVEWGQSGDIVYQGDFSTLAQEGVYTVYVPSLNQRSQPFEVGATVYNEVFRDALRFFYYSRSGEAITQPYAEGFTRPAYFDVDADYEFQNGTRDVIGGWFDAGDMHLDAHAPMEAVWWLLETLASFEDKVSPGSLNIPEESDSLSDLYELIKYELDWYFKMSDTDGSTYFWVKQYIGTTPLLSDKSSSGTAVKAGLFAKAYPLFKATQKYDAYADELLAEAEKSWDWLEANPNNLDPLDPATGQAYPYGTTNGQDEAYRSFAAINLYNATGTATYNTWYTSRFADPLFDFIPNQGWGGIISGLETQPVNLGYMDYIHSPQQGASLIIQNSLKQVFIDQADWTIERIGYTPYNIPLIAPNHLFWGSSALICTHAYVYDQVADWTNDDTYRNYIEDAVDWVLGRNPVNRVFVTGYGDDAHGTDNYNFYWDKIHPSAPGYLCGNINENASFSLVVPDPWKRFMNIQSANILEPGIYWNAEFAWLMGYKATHAGQAPDCHGDIGGSAILDDCNSCVLGNTGESPCNITIIKTTKETNDNVRLYPQPAITYVQFDSDTNFDNAIVREIQGKIIYKTTPALNTIDISSLQTGTYILELQNAQKSIQVKFIKN